MVSGEVRHLRRLPKSSHELVVMLGPPPTPPVEPLGAFGPVPQRLGARVAGIDAAPDGRLDAREGNVHRREQLGPAVPIQSEKSQALSSVVVDADREWGAYESGPIQRTEEGVNGS